MHVELLPLLRCLRPHVDAPLIVAVGSSVDRRIMTGTLGCSVCGAEYAIADGNAVFETLPAGSTAMGEVVGGVVASIAGGASEGRASERHSDAPDDGAMRLAALITLDDREGVWVLDGRWAGMAAALGTIVPATFLLLADRSVASDWPALVGAGDVVPLASASVRGFVLDHPSAALATSAARILVTGGRLVAPAATPVPAGVRELARDARQWAGEREPAAHAGPLVTPRRATPRTGN